MLAQRGDGDGALREYAEAVRLKPSLVVAEYNWGSLLAERGALADGPAALRARARARSELRQGRQQPGMGARRAGSIERRGRTLPAGAPDRAGPDRRATTTWRSRARGARSPRRSARRVRERRCDSRRMSRAPVPTTPPCLAGRGRTGGGDRRVPRGGAVGADHGRDPHRAGAPSSRPHGEEAAAVREYRTALEERPASPDADKGLAWVLATANDTAIRDPAEAVRLAESAGAATGRTDPGALDTLAAAYAASGRASRTPPRRPSARSRWHAPPIAPTSPRRSTRASRAIGPESRRAMTTREDDLCRAVGACAAD